MEEQGSKNIEEANNKKESWTDVFRFTIIIVAIIIPFRIFIAQPYIVQGSSMDPTFKNGDYLIVDQLSYRFGHPKRGDVIVLKYPNDTSKNFIKRVIGLPKDTVAIENGVVYITPENGEKVKVNDNYVKFKKQDNLNIKLGEKEYFVLGDNRAGSSDSRYWGTLPENDIIGRPILRLLPLSQISIFPGSQKK